MENDLPNIREKISQFTEESIGNYIEKCDQKLKSGKKVIHDPILGSNIFFPHEICIIDSPFLQRLRGIHQTSLAYHTYPSATHTRFEHSLGVTIWANRIAGSIKDRDGGSNYITNDYIQELRLASLLHDCGHGPFSHISEPIMAQIQEFKELQKESVFSGVKPHEIMSYLIVNSGPFQDFLNIIKEKLNLEYDSSVIGDYIIGRPLSNKTRYKPHILNGAVDADKLDYILRDSYVTGLKLVLDADRFLYQISVSEKKDGSHDLILDLSGISPMEQILFSKMLLTSSLYHHQKVRASDCMLMSLLEIAIDEGEEFYGSSLLDPLTFIKINDHDLLSPIGRRSKIYKDYLQKILNRDLLHRAFYISKDSIGSCNESTDSKKNSYYDMLEDFSDYCIHKEIRKHIANEAGGELKYYDIWIDFPYSPSFNEASQFEIRTLEGFRPFSDVFPIDRWLEAYNEIRYRGHLFCPAAHRDSVSDAFLEFIREQYKLDLKPLAWEMCKRNT